MLSTVRTVGPKPARLNWLGGHGQHEGCSLEFTQCHLVSNWRMLGPNCTALWLHGVGSRLQDESIVKIGQRTEIKMTIGRTLVADFLRARRENLQPEDVGLPRDPNRRVSGLRRSEVADLAGISAEYYVRLEQGRDHQPSEQVLAALGRALRLDDDGFAYLQRVARGIPIIQSSAAPRSDIPTSVVQLLDQWSHTPAYVSDANHDVLCANALARVMAPGYLDSGSNLLFSVFASDNEAERTAEWESTARSLVDSLRFGSDPADRRLQEIVGTLSVRDRRFRRMWADHNPRPLISGTMPLRVEPLGLVNFNWQTLEVPGQHGHYLTTFFGAPGSRVEVAIAYIADEIASGAGAAIGRDIAS